MLSCKGTDANMEVYIPQSIALSGPALARALAQPVIGYYALDLSEVGKGKPLEPVKVSMTVDFDQRFGTGAKCGPFQVQE